MEEKTVCEKYGHDARSLTNRVAIGLAKNDKVSETLKWFVDNHSDNKELILLGFGYGQVMADGNEKEMMMLTFKGYGILKAAEEYA